MEKTTAFVTYLLKVALMFTGNPLEEKHSTEGDWMERVSKSLKGLKKLDGQPIIKNDDDEDD